MKEKMLTLEPLLDRVILLPLEKQEEKSASGLILTGTSAESKFMEAGVVAIGPGVHQNGTFVPTTLKPLDIVYLPKNFGLPIKYQDQNYILVRENEILARVSK